MLETLSGKFNVILLTLSLLEGIYISFCGLYNVVSGNHSVQNSPWGEGGSIASARPGELHFTFSYDMGVPCSSSHNSKSIQDRNVMLAVLKR